MQTTSRVGRREPARQGIDGRAGAIGRGRRARDTETNTGPRGAAGEIDLRGDQLYAPGFGVAAAEGAPGVETNNQFRGAEQRFRGTRFVELNVAEHRFGAIPTPSQAQFGEAHVEARLSADEALERSAVLRHSGERQLVREQQESGDGAHAERAQQGNSQPAPGRSGRIGAGLRHRSHAIPFSEFSAI